MTMTHSCLLYPLIYIDSITSPLCVGIHISSTGYKNKCINDQQFFKKSPRANTMLLSFRLQQFLHCGVMTNLSDIAPFLQWYHKIFYTSTTTSSWHQTNASLPNVFNVCMYNLTSHKQVHCPTLMLTYAFLNIHPQYIRIHFVFKIDSHSYG